jgi:aminocarboxymuconate-semialdehyde decarboxylase
VKIDVFCHILTPRFNEKRLAMAPPAMNLAARIKTMPAIIDLEERFRIMDMFEDYVQILTVANPPVEVIADPEDAVEMSRIANDEMAELITKYPDRFVGGVACLPMNNPDAALNEIDRAIKELGLKGVQVFTHVKGRALDHPDFLPVFEKMAEYDLPIWLHPGRNAHFSDYPTEEGSLYEIWHIFGWTFDSSAAMTRLVFAGIFDKFPDLKIITHHLGGVVPYTYGRIIQGYNKVGKGSEEGRKLLDRLERHPHDYFKMFYADTATNGSVAALECGVRYFGPDRVLFGTDMPFDSEGGSIFVGETIKTIEEMQASEEDKQKIYEQNIKRLLKL